MQPPQPKPIKVKNLVHDFRTTVLRPNPEYQRGASWKRAQQQALVDSVFRGYPLPPLFLEKRTVSNGIDEGASSYYEIVDGQQRLLALREYYEDIFPLLGAQDHKLRLPASLRSGEAGWAGRTYSELAEEHRLALDRYEVQAYILEEVDNPDRIRDLFIRLQSGKALNRQQIRDAWPGNIGPFMERLAGKLKKRPSLEVFQYVDKRGAKLEEESLEDQYVSHRQTCAQFLRLFLARRDGDVAVGVGAGDLDDLYYENTNLDTTGAAMTEFVETLKLAGEIFSQIEKAMESVGRQKRTKVRKLDAFATVMFLQDTTRNKQFKLDSRSKARLARRIGEERSGQIQGKSTSGAAIRDHYGRVREKVTSGIGIDLDPRRLFDEEQKKTIFERDAGRCQVCEKPVETGNDEYDHFPLAHRDGGPTEIANGRLVHQSCHERGRPLAS